MTSTATEEMTFYLGTHRPVWLTWPHLADVPLFLAASTVQTMRRDRRVGSGVSGARWAFDSGAFMANSPRTGGNPDHPWHSDPDTYGGLVARVVDEIGILPDFAAPQDWPCEPGVRAVTGFTVADHHELTCDSYQWLASEFSWIAWAPVIQGWTVREYLAHMDIYAARGVDLAEASTVGLGSVCRRGSERPIVAIVEAVQARAAHRYGRLLRLHGFGLNIRALRRVAHLLASSDSLAWSDTARREHIRLPGCTHKRCNNCAAYALVWRARVLAAISAPHQLGLPMEAA